MKKGIILLIITALFFAQCKKGTILRDIYYHVSYIGYTSYILTPNQNIPFGEMNYFDSEKKFNFQLFNDSKKELRIEKIEISGSNSADFEYSLSSTKAKKSGAINLYLNLISTAVFGEKNITVTITTNAKENKKFVFSLTLNYVPGIIYSDYGSNGMVNILRKDLDSLKSLEKYSFAVILSKGLSVKIILKNLTPDNLVITYSPFGNIHQFKSNSLVADYNNHGNWHEIFTGFSSSDPIYFSSDAEGISDLLIVPNGHGSATMDYYNRQPKSCF